MLHEEDPSASKHVLLHLEAGRDTKDWQEMGGEMKGEEKREPGHASDSNIDEDEDAWSDNIGQKDTIVDFKSIEIGQQEDCEETKGFLPVTPPDKSESMYSVLPTKNS